MTAKPRHLLPAYSRPASLLAFGSDSPRGLPGFGYSSARLVAQPLHHPERRPSLAPPQKYSPKPFPIEYNPFARLGINSSPASKMHQ